MLDGARVLDEAIAFRAQFVGALFEFVLEQFLAAVADGFELEADGCGRFLDVRRGGVGTQLAGRIVEKDSIVVECVVEWK